MKKYVAILKDSMNGELYTSSMMFETESDARSHFCNKHGNIPDYVVAFAEVKWSEQVKKWRWVALDTHNEYFITNGYYVGKCEYNAKGRNKKNIAFVQKVEGSEKMMNPDEN